MLPYLCMYQLREVMFLVCLLLLQRKSLFVLQIFRYMIENNLIYIPTYIAMLLHNKKCTETCFSLHLYLYSYRHESKDCVLFNNSVGLATILMAS